MRRPNSVAEVVVELPERVEVHVVVVDPDVLLVRAATQCPQAQKRSLVDVRQLIVHGSMVRTAEVSGAVRFVRLGVHPGLLALQCGDGCGRIGQRVHAATRLGKAMTSRIESAPNSSATIRSQPKAIPPCGGAPKVKASTGIELVVGLLGIDTHHGEHAFLNVSAVDADRPATDLMAVADDVVCIGEYLTGVCADGILVAGFGSGERVMHRSPRSGTDRDVARGRGVVGRFENGGSTIRRKPMRRRRSCSVGERSHREPPPATPATSWPAQPRRTRSRRVSHRRGLPIVALGVGEVLGHRSDSVPSSPIRT